jgi:Fe-S oxidoreductase
MITTGKENDSKRIIIKLERLLGSESVLTDVEDLYVYSRLGDFGVRTLDQPLAVLRVSPEEIDQISELGIRLVTDTGETINDSSQGSHLFIVDSRDHLDPRQLKDALDDLENATQDTKETLRGRAPIYRWFTNFMNLVEGFRIDERSLGEKAFCVVQRFFNGVETFSSKGRLVLSRGLMKGELEPSERLVDSLFSCTTCGQCYDQLGVDSLEMENAVVRARREITGRGFGPGFGGSALRNILEERNPMGMPAEDRTLWWEELGDRQLYQGNEVLYWPGCTTAYRLPEVVEATSRVMETAGIDFGLLGEGEGCCGLILYLAGLWDQAVDIAEERVEELNGTVETLVTSCAGCYYAFSRIYPRLGVSPPFRVFHTSHLFDSLIQQDRFDFKSLKRRVVWHDPCDLGRHCGVYMPPRSVLRSISKLDLVEPPLNGEHALCCGGGGGVMAYDIDLAERMASAKLEDEFSSLGVDGVVTGCPACILNLRSASRGTGWDGEILDLSQCLLRAL